MPRELPLPRPFLKCVGGKRKLLPQILPLLPDHVDLYFEPFLGGGALFFELARLGRIGKAVLSDTNDELLATYRTVQSFPESVIEALGVYSNCKEQFLEARALDPTMLEPAQRAARFKFLNSTCFNGLIRVNSQGRFNVPFGDYRNPVICDRRLIISASEALSCASLLRADFEAVADGIRANAVVYFDPPYAPLSETSSFTSYTKAGFGTADQVRLRDVALKLKARGAKVIVSNSSAPLIRELYAGFTIQGVQARRNVNCKGGKRGNVTEMLIT